jgi:hypothetical protein
MNEFWGVSFVGRREIISVITGAYGRLLLDGAPDFYRNFNYCIFFSPKTFTELNAQLPFQLLKNERGVQVDALKLESLVSAEIEYIKVHHDILRVYRENNLEPLPPWKHIKAQKEASLALSDLMLRLENATKMFLQETARG